MTEPAVPPSSIVCFDDIRVELDGHRLFRAGVEVPLEPKAFAVLVAMLARPGHAFARDELLDAVWGHRHVTPGVLNRVIGLLRRALGDDTEQERYLQTVHGVGYRLVLPDAPVLAVIAATEIVAVPPDPVMTVPAAPAEQRRRVDDGIVPIPAIRPTPWRRFGLPLLAVAVLVGIGSVVWPPKSPPLPVAAAPVAQAPTLAVLPLRPLGNEPRESAFAEGLSEELITLLAQIDGLRVSSRTSSFLPGKPNDSLADIAARLKVNHILEGSVRQDGGKLRVTLRLVDVASDRAVWSQTYDRSSNDIFAIQSEIAQAVGNALRLQLNIADKSIPTLAMPGEDPTLYSRYLEARHFRRTTYSGFAQSTNADDAERELRAMVAAHPDYARAWGGLAGVLWARSLDVRADRPRFRTQAEQVAREALRRDPNQPDAQAVLGAMACREGDWEQGLARIQLAVMQAPSETNIRILFAQRLASAGYLRKAEEQLRIAEAMDPLSTTLKFFRARMLDTRGRHEEAGSILATLPDTSQASLYFNAVWRRDYTQAAAFARALPSEDRWRAPELATVQALQDPSLWPSVMPLIEASERAQHGEPALYNFVRFLLPKPDIPRDIAGLETVMRDGYASYNLALWQPEFRAHRAHPAFAAYLRRTGLEAYYRKHGWPDLCRPAGEAIHCD